MALANGTNGKSLKPLVFKANLRQQTQQSANAPEASEASDAFRKRNWESLKAAIDAIQSETGVST